MFGDEVLKHMVIVVSKWPRDPRTTKKRTLMKMSEETFIQGVKE